VQLHGALQVTHANFIKRLRLSANLTKMFRNDNALARFILFKKVLATLLIPILLCLASYTLMRWTFGVFVPSSDIGISFKNLNNVFFDQFFSILIIVDVVLLLSSLFLTNDFHKVILKCPRTLIQLL
jgi:hypothetical protein